MKKLTTSLKLNKHLDYCHVILVTGDNISNWVKGVVVFRDNHGRNFPRSTRPGYMDSEHIVICTLYNKWPFSYSYKFSLATEPSFTIVQKEKKVQNTLHKIRHILVTYFGNVLCSSLNNVEIVHSAS